MFNTSYNLKQTSKTHPRRQPISIHAASPPINNQGHKWAICTRGHDVFLQNLSQVDHFCFRFWRRKLVWSLTMLQLLISFERLRMSTGQRALFPLTLLYSISQSKQTSILLHIHINLAEIGHTSLGFH